MLKPWASFFTLHCSSLLNYINEYLAIDSGGYVYKQPSCIICSICLDASQRSWDGVWLNREVKCKGALSNPEDRILRYIRTYLLFYLTESTQTLELLLQLLLLARITLPVRSVETITQIYHHLKTYLITLLIDVCSQLEWCLSIFLLANLFVLNALLSLVSKI